MNGRTVAVITVGVEGPAKNMDQKVVLHSVTNCLYCYPTGVVCLIYHVDGITINVNRRAKQVAVGTPGRLEKTGWILSDQAEISRHPQSLSKITFAIYRAW